GHGWRHVLTAFPLAWCGLWVSGLWSVIAIPLFVCACVMAARERNGLFFLYALPGFILVGVHAALANHYARYNLGLVGPLAVGAAWMIARMVVGVRGTRLARLTARTARRARPGGRTGSLATCLVRSQRIGDGDLARQERDQLQLGAQLEMQVEQHDQADHHPHIEDEIDAAADADEFGEARRVRRKPHEVES